MGELSPTTIELVMLEVLICRALVQEHQIALQLNRHLIFSQTLRGLISKTQL
jgi:hypothetical protein